MAANLWGDATPAVALASLIGQRTHPKKASLRAAQEQSIRLFGSASNAPAADGSFS